MAKLPAYISEGWRPNGPGGCRCPDCGSTVSTNALARASHARACYRKLQERKAAAAKTDDTPKAEAA